MGFGDGSFAYASPAEAVAGMVARLGGASLGEETCPLRQACGRVLANAVRLDRDSPPVDASAMDGYAVRLGDSGVLRVAGEAAMGAAPMMMPPAGVVRVSTGSALPLGAEAVIKREDAAEREEEIELPAGLKVKAGQHVRRRGENGRAGTVVLEAGRLLSPTAIGALAAVGTAEVRVLRRVRVAVIPTGDELTAAPGEHGIRDSNGPGLEAVLAARAWIEVRRESRVRDELEQVERAVRAALDWADAVITTGGVSMGRRDFVREAVERVGGEVVFHGLPQKPGKPMLGAVVGDKALFGLPGNPVSALITAVRIAAPVLAARAGVRPAPAPVWTRVVNPDGRTMPLWQHRLVRVAEGGVELVEERGSGDLVAAGRSDGFVEYPPGPIETQALVPYSSWM